MSLFNKLPSPIADASDLEAYKGAFGKWNADYERGFSCVVSDAHIRFTRFAMSNLLDYAKRLQYPPSPTVAEFNHEEGMSAHIGGMPYNHSIETQPAIKTTFSSLAGPQKDKVERRLTLEQGISALANTPKDTHKAIMAAITVPCLQEKVKNRVGAHVYKEAETTDQQEPHFRLWSNIFKDYTWLNSAVQIGCHPCLIGPELDHQTSLWIVLFVWDTTGDLRYSFESSLRNYQKLGYRVYMFGNLTVQVCGLHNECDVIRDSSSKLFMNHEELGGITTKYCFWTDPTRGVDAVKPGSIIGVGGQITSLQDTVPIAAINLHPLPGRPPIQLRVLSDDYKNRQLVPGFDDPASKDLYGAPLPRTWHFPETNTNQTAT
ncbi:hypothetical protein BU23DRAFT_556154 [Bimuria novae-zelandiae CBS 107.79]|uniref:Uncharacterized protein n=1 Tax=Bimuria novae-zelandiae CBS 107.79 TaxID=1447943 RepID=A0A6A5V126_9PLEO|nr:hypothetical protein BU23DRAFT_556154 [Bimuria novae-zelandiae CBS 107.79]